MPCIDSEASWLALAADSCTAPDMPMKILFWTVADMTWHTAQRSAVSSTGSVGVRTTQYGGGANWLGGDHTSSGMKARTTRASCQLQPILCQTLRWP